MCIKFKQLRGSNKKVSLKAGWSHTNNYGICMECYRAMARSKEVMKRPERDSPGSFQCYAGLVYFWPQFTIFNLIEIWFYD